MDMKKNLIIDLAALLVYLVVANPAVTGIALHEWLGLGVLVVFLVHVAVHYDWVIETLRVAFTKPTWVRTGNLILGALILVAFMVCLVSGLLVSGAFLPTLGLYADGYYFWNPIHALSAKVLLALLLVHVVVHGKWILLFITKGKDPKDGNGKGN